MKKVLFLAMAMFCLTTVNSAHAQTTKEKVKVKGNKYKKVVKTDPHGATVVTPATSAPATTVNVNTTPAATTPTATTTTTTTTPASQRSSVAAKAATSTSRTVHKTTTVRHRTAAVPKRHTTTATVKVTQ
jgi:hypothetical protein